MQATSTPAASTPGRAPAAGAGRDLPWGEFVFRQAEGIMTLGDANTTVAYCRYGDDGEVEYLFVASPWRRRGLARWLLGQVAACAGEPLRFREPLSPAGRQLVDSWIRSRRD